MTHPKALELLFVCGGGNHPCVYRLIILKFPLYYLTPLPLQLIIINTPCVHISKANFQFQQLGPHLKLAKTTELPCHNLLISPCHLAARIN